eukprot:symbB.v1.2.005200.t2/scaffold299.1/size236002/12
MLPFAPCPATLPSQPSPSSTWTWLPVPQRFRRLRLDRLDRLALAASPALLASARKASASGTSQADFLKVLRFVPGVWERIFPVVRHTACKATSQSEEFGFEIGPVLQEAHKVWGRLYEDHVVRQARSHYQMVVGERFEVDMGKQGQIDFLGVGTGAEAWEAFAQEYPVQMCDATCSTLQGPHFLIAEIGLTSATLKKKFKDNARSLKLLQGFVSSLNATGIGAVKCLVYDGADAEDVAESEEGKQFMDEGGILMNIPYLTAETVLAKLEEPAKLREEIGKLGEEIAKLKEDLQLSGLSPLQGTTGFRRRQWWL